MSHALASGLTGLLALGLGGAVLLKSRCSSERKAFAWLCLTIFGWLFSYGFMESAATRESALLWARLGHSSCVLGLIAYVQFTRYFLNLPWLAPLYRAQYVIGAVLLWFVWSSDRFIADIFRWPWGYYPLGGPAMAVAASLCLTVVSFCWVLFLVCSRQAHRAGDHQRYNRLKYGCLALAVFSLATLDYLPKFGIPYYPLGFAATAVFVSLITYAILVHHLMDISVVLKKSLVYSILVGVLTAVYLSMVLLAERLLQGVVGYRSLVGSLSAGFIIALGFIPLKEWVQALVDRWVLTARPAALAEQNAKLRQELTRHERLKAVATLAAGVAHEIRNPLATLTTFAEELPARGADAGFRATFARLAQQELGKMTRLAQQLMDFAKPAIPALEPVRLAPLVQETADLLHSRLLAQRIQVQLAIAEDLTLRADPQQLKQVLLNLLLNSLEAMTQPGTITLAATPRNGALTLTVTDTGRGMSRQELARVGEPFFTTKPTGTGLGLSVVHSLLQAHGGRVTLQSTPGQGTRVQLTFPLTPPLGGRPTAALAGEAS
jgi:signal transduction histidine kinase